MKTLLPILLLMVSLAGAATGQNATKASGNAKTSGPPEDQEVNDNDKAMDRAVFKARESLGFFLAALKAHKPDSEAFAVKKCCIQGEKVEHIWVGDVRWDGKAFHGRVDNKPLDISNVALGQRVTVTPKDLTDWMFVKDGKLIGGFTTRVFYSRLSPEQKVQFQKRADFKLE